MSKFSFFMLLLLSFSVEASAVGSKCASLMGTCDYYRCLNDTMACQPGAYFKDMGLHYCSRFNEYYDQLSPQGQKFVDNLRLCLQETMERTFPVITCGNAKIHAHSHHIKCYKMNNFCQLSVRDKIVIAVTASPAIVIDPLMKKANQEIRQTCASQ